MPLRPPFAFTASTWWIWLLPSSNVIARRGHVEPPHPGPASPDQRAPRRPSRASRFADPRPQRQRVVLAQALDVAHLEARPLDRATRPSPTSCSSPSGKTYRSMNEHRLNRAPGRARTRAPRRSADPVVQQPALGQQERVAAGRSTSSSCVEADVLEHADRADRVERAVVDVAVVLQADLDPVAEPGLGDPLRRQLGLALRDGDADRAHPVVPRPRASTMPPQPHPTSSSRMPGCSASLLADELVLARPARPRAPASGVVPDRARVRHRRTEHDPVEVVRDVVVVRDRGRVARGAVTAPAQPAPLPAGSVAGGGRRRPRASSALSHCSRREVEAGEAGAELERGEDVTLDVDVARDVRATEAELGRRGDDPAHRVRGSHDDRGGRMLRPGVTAVVGLEADGEVFAEDPRDKIRDRHGHVPSVLRYVERNCTGEVRNVNGQIQRA